MASITWRSPTPQKIIVNGIPTIFGRCDYTIDVGQGWEKAEMVANTQTQQYTGNMVKDDPVVGQCQGSIGPIPTGTYDVTAKLYYTLADGSHGIVNTTVAQVTI